MDERNFLIIITALLNLALGSFVYFRGKRSPVDVLFSIFSFSVGIWSLAILFFINTGSVPTLRFMAWLSFFSGNVIFLSFSWFSLFFVTESPRWPKRLSFFSFVNLLFLVFIAFPGVLFKSFIIGESLNKVLFSLDGLVLYAFFVISAFLFGEFMLLSKYNGSSGEKRQQLNFILSGTIIAGALGLTSNLILPAVGIFTFFWLGPVFSTVMLVPIFYSIVRYKFLNLRTLAAEIFTSLLIIISLINLLTSKTRNEAVTQGAVLFFVMVFGFLLIRSVLQEVRSREEIERLAGSLKKANEALKRLDKAKSEFVSIASHQLRTPLTIIKGYISLLSEGSFGPVNEQTQKVLNRIYLSNERLIKLVNDLLDLSRIESGKMQYMPSDFDMTELMDSVAEEFKIPALDKEIQIKWKKPEEEIHAWGDQQKVRQVVFNLVDNALKYTPAGTIEIKLEKYDDKAKLSVKDSGIGMSQTTIELLFKKFSRGEKVPTINTEGTGLGLYVAKRIVEDHKGKIWAESLGESKGSVFYMELPTKNPVPKLNIVPYKELSVIK
ncbi:hypothetical protein HYT01_04345 [Candidatus Giovannonibacteria bacterium]|nr:hypothetical protein [Candidatus Giovannonibacteria bacterium]